MKKIIKVGLCSITIFTVLFLPACGKKTTTSTITNTITKEDDLNEIINQMKGN